MNEYIKEILDFYFKQNTELVTIESIRDMIAEKYSLSKVKALNIIKKTLVNEGWTSRHGSTKYLIMLSHRPSFKEYSFNGGAFMYIVTHIKVMDR